MSGFQIFVGIIIYSTFWSLALWVCVCTHTRVHECMSWLTHLQVSEQNMDVDSSDLAADAFAWWDTLPAFTLFFWNRICHWTWNFLKDKSGWPVSFKDLVISIPPGSGIIGTGYLCAWVFLLLIWLLGDQIHPHSFVRYFTSWATSQLKSICLQQVSMEKRILKIIRKVNGSWILKIEVT